MSYGRIDIYWPEGPIESYPLNKPVVAIGRSSGNDIILDTAAVSRYHLSLTRKDQQVFLEDLDSVNGTYLDGARLASHQPLVLRGGEEIQIGDLRLIFHPEEDKHQELPTQPILAAAMVERTRKIEVQQTHFKIELDPPPMPVTPGAYVQATLTVRNVGATTEHYTIEVGGVPREWVRIERSQIELDPNESVSLLISFKPLRRPETTPGDYNVTIKVISNAGQTAEASLNLTLRSYSGFGVALGTPEITPDSKFVLHLHNQGNAPLTLEFTGSSPDAKMVFRMEKTKLTLGAGEGRELHGLVQLANKPLFGGAKTYRFDLLAQSHDASGFLTAVEGLLVEKARFPMWVIMAILPLLIFIVVSLGFGGMALLNNARPLTLQTVNISSPYLFEGDSVLLTWSVTNADVIEIKLDEATLTTLPADNVSYSHAMTTSGDHTFTVVAIRGDQRVSKQVMVTVNKLLQINSLTVSPNPMLRYVRQSVTISWEVSGATQVQFKGIEALTGNPDEQIREAKGQTTLSGTPRDTMTLKLIAIGKGNQTRDQEVRVEIKNPICQVAVDLISVYEGPGTVYGKIKDLTLNTEVYPDGRDSSAQWVHLAPSPDPQAWVEAKALRCNDFTPDALIAFTTVPPTPTASPSATATPTATMTSTSLPTATATMTTTLTTSATATPIVAEVSAVDTGGGNLPTATSNVDNNTVNKQPTIDVQKLIPTR